MGLGFFRQKPEKAGTRSARPAACIRLLIACSLSLIYGTCGQTPARRNMGSLTVTALVILPGGLQLMGHPHEKPCDDISMSRQHWACAPRQLTPRFGILIGEDFGSRDLSGSLRLKLSIHYLKCYNLKKQNAVPITLVGGPINCVIAGIYCKATDVFCIHAWM